MKSVSKVGLAILKDLILRLQQAGPRASLAEPLDWEGADNEWVFFLEMSSYALLVILLTN